VFDQQRGAGAQVRLLPYELRGEVPGKLVDLLGPHTSRTGLSRREVASRGLPRLGGQQSLCVHGQKHSTA